jgi:hypothetical protein
MNQLVSKFVSNLISHVVKFVDVLLTGNPVVWCQFFELQVSNIVNELVNQLIPIL